MKRSGIKRKKALKSKPLKAKRKPKTALQKRKDKMDSPYWNRKCGAAVTVYMHTQACFVCGRKEPACGTVAGHHLVRKSRSRLYRWHPMNIIPLCSEHHLYSTIIAAHSDNALAVVEFAARIRCRDYARYVWWASTADEIRHKDLRSGPIERPDWRSQYEFWANRIERE